MRIFFEELGIWYKFWLGFISGLIVISVAIEVVSAFFIYNGEDIFFSVIKWVATFRWLAEYQTLITGIAAVWAAVHSVRAIKAQIKQTSDIESDRKIAKHAAARAVLPLSLAVLSAYSERNTLKLRHLLEKCSEGALSKTGIDIPNFESIPGDVISVFKEMVEYSPHEDRRYFVRLLTAIQVQGSILNGLKQDYDAGTRLILAHNIKTDIMGQAEIYARAAALYDFGRGAIDTVPQKITRKQVGSALFLIGIFDEVRDELVSLYRLDSDDIWEPISSLRTEVNG
jgi:hypothetical protein